MPIITVRHQALELNWLSPEQIENPKTLVLGSFNPYNRDNNSVDYYYGRKSNHFWRTIANIIGENEEFFFDLAESQNRKSIAMNNRFCCLDVINFINFSCDSNQLLNEYLFNKIFSNFLDQNIWTTNTNYEKRGIIKLSREYNQNIITTLSTSTTIRKVIHTMGNNRIGDTFVSPKEKRLNNLGFGGFIQSVKEICHQRNIEFVKKSYSPSDYAIKNGNTTRENLRYFLRQHLCFDE